MLEVSWCNNNNFVLHCTDTWNTPLPLDRSGANSQTLYPTSSELEATWHSYCTYSSFMVSLASLPLFHMSDVTKNKYDRTKTFWCYRTMNITTCNMWLSRNTLYLRKTTFSFVSTVTVESKFHYFITKKIFLKQKCFIATSAPSSLFQISVCYDTCRPSCTRGATTPPIKPAT